MLEAVRNHGLEPGEDISLIGFEECDEDVMAFERHGITSFRLDTPAIAVGAVRLLLKRMEQPGEKGGARTEALELKFIERTSVKKLNHPA